MLDQSDNNLVLYLAGCTLAKKAGKNNWVEEDAVGGLPEYICRIARAIHRDGSHSVSQSIAIAVGRVKTWARGGGGVNADTRAKAAKAVAEWEKKKVAAKANNKVKMSNSDYLMVLLAKSYNIDDVRNQYREQFAAPNNYVYVREMWSDYMIVSEESSTGTELDAIKMYKVDYSVDKDGKATFSDRKEVKQAYVLASGEELETRLTDTQLEKAGLIPCTEKVNRSLLDTVRLAHELKLEESELMKLSEPVINLLRSN